MIIGLDASRATTARRTGTEAYALHLIRALIPLVAERGHTLRLYFNALPDPDLFHSSPNVELVVIPWPRLWTHVRLGHELRHRPPDVFFTPAHVIPVGIRCPSVATVHDLGYERFPEAHPRRQLAYLRWSTRHNARVARHIIADSQTTADDLGRFYGTPASRIAVVYPGRDPDLRRVTDEAQIAAALGRYAIRLPYLLYLGTLQPRKNLARLVDAFATSGLADDGYSLVLAGNVGWLAESLLDAVRRLPPAVGGRIILPGFIDEVDKAALLSGATALVFPSLYEGFGFPVLEAQVCGAPVVCSNTSSLPEVAGEGALLVDPRDTVALAGAIRRVATDVHLRQALVERGYANRERFAWEAAGRSALSVLES